MVDEQVKKQLDQSISQLEEYARRNISPDCPGRSVYYDTLDAARICRHEISRIPESDDNRTYVGKVIRALKAERERYRYAAADEGGYGVSTFHQVIREATALYESLEGREEELEIPADKLKTQLLYMAADPWERCFRAFATVDYVGCIVEASKIIDENPETVRRQVFLLMLLSTQRVGQGAVAEEFASKLTLPHRHNDAWFSALVELIVGSKRPDEVAVLAQDEWDRCQFDFYAGQRLLTEGRDAAAAASFKACVASSADSDERFLALAELHPSNRAAIASIYQLSLRAHRCQEGGDSVQAIDLATHAYEMASQHLGEEDPVTLSLTLRLARLCKAYG
jgi:hypothetical protein